MKKSDIMTSALILGIIMIIILPLPTWLFDALIIMNIILSLFIMLTTLFIKEALEFSVLPTLLLITTLFRLSLNLSSTKLILGNGGDAGEVIKTFGSFVIGGNLVVGIVAFLIIVAIQFIVITKGAERVSEVAARFTLDAMPGKQMAIDADLNTGAIDEATARKRRSDIQREADFYGAMDGASKFIKGDAIIAIVIIIVNIVGGLIVGLTMEHYDISKAVNIYVLATVGDGLVSQIPALLISTSTGIVVTRSASDASFGVDLTKQLLSNPTTMLVCGGILLAMCLIPGFPVPQLLVISTVLISTGLYMRSKIKTKPAGEPVPEDKTKELAEEKRKPENVLNLLQVEQLELEFGYGIVPMIDTSLGGDLLDRIIMIRRQCAIELGIILPSIRMRDNVRLNTNEYKIMIKGVEVAGGEVMPDHYLAINSDGVDETITGVETIEPTFGLPALWITKKQRERAELLGYTTIDPPSVITTHLMEVIKAHAYELVNRQQVQMLMENLSQQQPALVEEVVPKMFTYGDIQKILVRLLRENIPIKNLATIIETLAEYGTVTKNPDDLTEYVRQNLARVITSRFLTGDDVAVLALDSKVEQLIAEKTKRTEAGIVTVLEPSQLQSIFKNTREIMDKMTIQGKKSVALTAPAIRPRFKKLIEQIAPNLTVLSYAEVEQSMELHIESIIKMT
ncbi:flagellar biosynthesis protein FlhA [Sporobacter termitidis DSM 10068]|uniref:Flagellar biosynthesis protein FlhA n=1 Tax=Sporobacter termitidis DSM 10068 TaxID=1123282 RepID=A0A1M5W7A9_9FIRM|nr:flagellar biosynthesis protein FlhA [Sporobacter termitidis]SHH83355.1 flagellar biosynthesis protein FlhA [Sporobacter termitidis DSM 10068]